MSPVETPAPEPRATGSGKGVLRPQLGPGATGVLVLADGTVLCGKGVGREGEAVGEICFNTAMTGYQEILTDPSYAGQIITFTFPHIGNVGTNGEDIETVNLASLSGVRGAVMHAAVSSPSNYRSQERLDKWLSKRNIIGLSGIDTRALTHHIRAQGYMNGVIAHNAKGRFNIEDLHAKAAQWSGLVGLDLAKDVTCTQSYTWEETGWCFGQGYGRQQNPRFHVVAVDYGIKRNILRCLAGTGCRVTILPATATAEDVLSHKPDGVFLSNGPGDPAATGVYAVPTIQGIVKSGLPLFGICLGHQMLALALGAKTEKMHQGHHGANHPVKDVVTGKVEITSMNHGFTVARESLPNNVRETHVSLFDGSNCGIAVEGKPIFSVQYHPEASPGPQDSHYLFKQFYEAMEARK